MYPATKRAKTAQPQSQPLQESSPMDLEVTDPGGVVHRLPATCGMESRSQARKPIHPSSTTAPHSSFQPSIHARMHMRRQPQLPQPPQVPRLPQHVMPPGNDRRQSRRRRRSRSETHGPSLTQHDIIRLGDNDSSSNGSDDGGSGELAAKRPMLMATEPDSQEPPMHQRGSSSGRPGHEAATIVLDDDDGDQPAGGGWIDNACGHDVSIVKMRSFSCSSTSSSAQLPSPAPPKARQSSTEAPIWFTPQQRPTASPPALQSTNQKLKELHMLRQQRRQQRRQQQQK